MRNGLWVMCVGAIMAVTVISTLSVLVITNQRAELTTLRNQVATQTGIIANLNSTLVDTNGRLTVLAQKVNPLIGAECHVDQVFYQPEDVPENYTGHLLVVPDVAVDQYVGLGVICR